MDSNYIDKNLILSEQCERLSPEFCKHVINRFTEDDRKVDGGFGRQGRTDHSIKHSYDLNITDPTIYPTWKNENVRFKQCLSMSLAAYEFMLGDTHGKLFPFYDCDKGVRNSGFQIQYSPANTRGYDWHSDEHIFGCTDRETFTTQTWNRGLTYIFYLNDVPDGSGYTEFIDGTKVQPRAGKFLIFPATWTYLHRGYPTDHDKYIATGWVYGKRTLNIRRQHAPNEVALQHDRIKEITDHQPVPEQFKTAEGRRFV